MMQIKAWLVDPGTEHERVVLGSAWPSSAGHALVLVDLIDANNAVHAAVAAEHERCAKLCELLSSEHGECPEMAQYYADAIRAGLKNCVSAPTEIERLRAALVKLSERIKDHPAYADLTESEESDIGGDTAELSYLARVADGALRPSVAVSGGTPPAPPCHDPSDT